MGYKDPAMQRQYQRDWIAKNRLDWIAEHGPCAKCGSKKDLEVDHVDPTKKVWHRIWSWSPARRAKELAKCQVLCGECHQKKTVEYLRRNAKHGTSSEYSYGCRCSKCREANAQRVAGWRRRNKKRTGGGMAVALA
jgi:5-methylcytosine-specific restriction endonuclease McrA